MHPSLFPDRLLVWHSQPDCQRILIRLFWSWRLVARTWTTPTFVSDEIYLLVWLVVFWFISLLLVRPASYGSHFGNPAYCWNHETARLWHWMPCSRNLMLHRWLTGSSKVCWKQEEVVDKVSSTPDDRHSILTWMQGQGPWWFICYQFHVLDETSLWWDWW